MNLGKEMVEQFVTTIAAGNIGAASCCVDLIKNHPAAYPALVRALTLGIKGDKLYLVWNDCCDRDANKTVEVLLKRSEDEILDHIDMEKNQGRGKPF